MTREEKRHDDAVRVAERRRNAAYDAVNLAIACFETAAQQLALALERRERYLESMTETKG